MQLWRGGGVLAAALSSWSVAFASGTEALEPPVDRAGSWQCVPFARTFTGIQLFGDAWTWWSQAAGKYARGAVPEAGSVLVFKPFGSMAHGHVAVVSHVLTDRIIQVVHANWSPVDGRRGQVEDDVTVVDVSSPGDWSLVKVWYRPAGDLGNTAYPTYGFIYRPAGRTLAQVQAGAPPPSP